VAEIQFAHVGKVYGNDVAAVRDLNLEIVEGEFMVLVGPSGCGKTTALRMVAGLEEITLGEIRIGGRVVNELAPRERDIAMVFQNYALYPHKSVYENLVFGLRMRKVPKAEQRRRVEEIARKLGLADMLERRPAQLSGGQRQRVAMGRAIVREPKAFLMDEPLSNLDAKLRVQMRAEIARIQQALKVTTLYVTHDQVEAMTMGHRVAVMRDGVLQQVDTPQRLYDAPVNLFVASFVGSPPMNLFEAVVEQDGSSLLFGETRVELPTDVTAVQDGDVLPVLGGLRVLHTPGHTPGSICLYSATRRLLIVGDLLQRMRGQVTLPNYFFTDDMPLARRSIARLAELDVETILFSHYPPVRQGGREALRALAS